MSRDLAPAFERLKAMMSAAQEGLVLRTDAPDSYVLVTPSRDARGREVHFGAVELKKNYVSYHLVPVYTHPDLLEGMSPELKERMQGKSCFNFTRPDNPALGELEGLTARSLERYRSAGLA